MMNNTRAALRKLKKMKLRTIGISFVISLAMALLVSGLYLGDTFDHTVDRYFEDNRMPDAFFELSEPQDQVEVENALSSVPGVLAHDVRLKSGGLYDNSGEDVAVQIYGIADPFRDDINRLTITDGERYDEFGEAVALLGNEDMGIDVDEAIQVTVNGKPVNLTLTGLVSSPEFLFPNSFSDYGLPMGADVIIIFMDLGELQDVTGDGVNDVYVLMEDGGDVDDVAMALAPFGLKRTTLQDDHPSKVFMEMGATKMRNMFPLIGSIFGIVGFISIFMTIFRIVKNDSRYIGVMMSLGHTRTQIIRAYLTLGLVLTLIGGAIGTFLAVLFAQGIMNVSADMYPALTPVYPFAPAAFIIGWVFIIGSVMVSVGIPISMVTNMTVREALDYKPSMTVRANRKLGRNMSRITTMGFRNSTRNPGRTLLTMIVVGMTIGIAGSWLVMMDSAWGYMGDMASSDRWDLRGDLIAPVNESDIFEDVSIIGLQESDLGSDGDLIPFSHMGGYIRSGGRTGGSGIFGCDRWEDVKQFRLQRGELDFNRAVIDYNMAKDMELDPGDTIVLDVGGRSVELEVSGIVYDLFTQVVYTSKDKLDDLFPAGQCTGVFVFLEDDSPENQDACAKSMQSAPMVSNVMIQDDISDGLNDVLDQAMGMLYFFFFLNILIAIVVAASAVIISTMERDIEFATLDTLGISRWKVGKSIMVEMGVLSAGAALVGVPMAYLFGWVFAKVMSEVLFYFPLMFVISSAVLIVVSGFAFVLLSSMVPIRYAGKLDTEKTLRERTAG